MLFGVVLRFVVMEDDVVGDVVEFDIAVFCLGNIK